LRLRFLFCWSCSYPGADFI